MTIQKIVVCSMSLRRLKKSSLGASEGRKSRSDGWSGGGFEVPVPLRAASRARNQGLKETRKQGSRIDARDLTRPGPVAQRIRHFIFCYMFHFIDSFSFLFFMAIFIIL